MTTPTSGKLTIFEGPDGSGKTTKALSLTSRTNASYNHFGPLSHVKTGYVNLFVEAMLPALLGYQDVVFDRSWLSEKPYSVAYRDGSLRVDEVSQRMLERLAMRCGVALVRCEPGWEYLEKSYLARQADEYLDNIKQLRQIRELYNQQSSDLPTAQYDYNSESTKHSTKASGLLEASLEVIRTKPHDLRVASAGNLEAKIMLIGSEFDDHKDHDPWYQWPFASFDITSSGRWLTQQLVDAEITEDQLLWVNADQPIELLPLPGKLVVALGAIAADKLTKLGIKPFQVITHPQTWMRAYPDKEYPLIKLLKEEL